MNYKEKIALIEKEIQLLKVKKEIAQASIKQASVMPSIENRGNTPKEQKLFYWTQERKIVKDKRNRNKEVGGWKLIRDDLKETRTWKSTDGKAQTKEFDAVELEKDGQKQIVVLAGGIYKIWN